MTITKEGTYRAAVIASGVNDSRQGKPPYFQAEFEARQEGEVGTLPDGTEGFIWTNIPKVNGEYPRIIGDFYVIKNDGNVFDFCWQNLMSVFGWDGVDLESLNNADFSKVKCQIVIGPEEYNGKTSMKIKWLNVFDATPRQRTVRKAKNTASLKQWSSRGPVKKDDGFGGDDLSNAPEIGEENIPF